MYSYALFTWGWGANGANGLGNTTHHSVPMQVGVQTDWTYVFESNAAVFAIKSNGTLWTWGGNGNGALGLGDAANRSSPVQVGNLSDWSKVQASQTGATLAIKTDGTLWAWGYGSYGAHGLGDTANRSSPVQVGSLTTWSTVRGGGDMAFAIKTDGTLWGWGRNNNGNLGQSNTTERSSPVQVGTLTDWAFVAVGGQSTRTIRKAYK